MIKTDKKLHLALELFILENLLATIHWTEFISSHHTIFAPVQKVKITLAKFKKAQGFVKTLQVMSFQNNR